MDAKTQRQVARRRARETRSRQDVLRREREQRIENLAVTVLVAVTAIAEQERRAGDALRAMIEVEGLSLHEAVGWCSGEISLRTAARLKREAMALDAPDGPIATTAADGDHIPVPAARRSDR